MNVFQKSLAIYIERHKTMENNKELIEEMENLSKDHKFDFIRSYENEKKYDDETVVRYNSVEQYYNTYKGTGNVLRNYVSCQTKML